MLTLTPQARAIAAFTLAVALLTGQLNRIAWATLLVIGDVLPAGRAGQFLISLVLVAVAAVTVAFALNASRGPVDGWALHLAQAAVVVAAVGLGIAALAAVGTLVDANPSNFPVSLFNSSFFG
ncbi:hypothetical protein [Marmoricola sp. RAF53]|uniref:hypothetical protein n=1 Tax=Marmoricola sp. RAF53 TaxID=3233059 RepID=UPI003F955876